MYESKYIEEEDIINDKLNVHKNKNLLKNLEKEGKIKNIFIIYIF